MSTEVLSFSVSDLQQLQATAWSTARLLGASFTKQCWDQLSQTIRDSLTNPPPPKDVVVNTKQSSEAHLLIAHARVVHLVQLMFESAVPDFPESDHLILLNESTLHTALKIKLCLWPFWLDGC